MSIQNNYETNPHISNEFPGFPAHHLPAENDVPAELEAQIDFSPDELGLTTAEAAELAAAEDAWPEDELIEPLY